MHRPSAQQQQQDLEPTEEPLRMLGEPSPTLGSKIPDPTQSSEQSQSALKLEQGKQSLSTYIQIANSQRQGAPEAQEEEEFVDAFVTGLRDKRNIQKAKSRLKKNEKTWDKLMNCFPTASQAVRQHMEDKLEPAREAQRVTLDAQEGQIIPPPATSNTSREKNQDKLPSQLPELPSIPPGPVTRRPLRRIKPAGISLKDFLAQNEHELGTLEGPQTGHGVGVSQIVKSAHQSPLIPTLPAAGQRQTEQSSRSRVAALQQNKASRPNQYQGKLDFHSRPTAERMSKAKDQTSSIKTRKRPAMDSNQGDEYQGLPAPNQEAAKAQQAAKRRKKAPIKEKRPRAPLIPIVPSSEDDFA